MAADWVPVGRNTPKCAEVVRVARRCRRSRRDVLGALVEFWLWVSLETEDGFLPGYKLDDLPVVIDDTDPSFWQAVADEGWVIQHEDGLRVPDNVETPFIEKGAKARLLKARRQAEWRAGSTEGDGEASTDAPTPPSTEASTSASRKTSPTETVTETDSVLSSNTRSDPIQESIRGPTCERSDLLVTEEDLRKSEPLVASLFKRAAYSGKDGDLLWKLGALVTIQALPERLVVSACHGAGLNARRNHVGFVRKALTADCEKEGIDLKTLLKALKMPALKHKGPPLRNVPAMASSLGDTLGRKE